MTIKKILVTGGAGFIGSSLIRYLINHTEHLVKNIDKLTYAGNLESLSIVKENSNYSFHRIDITNRQEINCILEEFHPDIVFHLAAESHVDRSIHDASEFMKTNIMGTFVLLEESLSYWSKLKGNKRNNFRFHHVSTDEVYGDLRGTDLPFTEENSYIPSSPYSASKASSDHLVRAWFRTYDLPILITNCSNNYGPFQFPEKLVPVIILNAINGKKIPIYGNGKQIRDWLYVDDHVRGLYKCAISGRVGETYNIGGNNEIQNIDVAYSICEILDELLPCKNLNIKKYKELITFVDDRAGHDIRYAIDSSKIQKEIGWMPIETFKTGLRKTVEWYLKNLSWVKGVENMNSHIKSIGINN